MSFTYLASPYSHPELDIMQARYEAALEAVAWLLHQRVWTYSPIVHCHELAVHFKLPRDATYWNEYNRAMLSRANRLLVLTLKGWQGSSGIKAEIEWANMEGLKINYLNPINHHIWARPAKRSKPDVDKEI